MAAYYNEFDPRAAAWLRELIAEGRIADGIVDERSILDVRPDDLRGFEQCHFFAGIGGWSLALRLAGWPDDKPVWTGSCPCQPFSEAGAGKGFADERHLWPAWHYLIESCRPPVLFGEQVEAAIRYGWLDLVRDDLEGIGFAFAAASLPAACVGAPHIRQRLWFVADASGQRQQQHAQCLGTPVGKLEASRWYHAGGCSRPTTQCMAYGGGGARPEGRDARAMGLECTTLERSSAVLRVADANRGGQPCEAESADHIGPQGDGSSSGLGRCRGASGFWSRAEWLACRDGKARPTEPGIFPLAHGVPDRVGLLRGAGNAIVPQVAAAFIKAYLDAL